MGRRCRQRCGGLAPDQPRYAYARIRRCTYMQRVTSASSALHTYSTANSSTTPQAHSPQANAQLCMPGPPAATSGSNPPSSSPVSDPEAATETASAYSPPASPPPAYTSSTHPHPEREPPSDEETSPLLQFQPTPSTSRSASPDTASPPRNRNIMDGPFRFSLPRFSNQAMRNAGVYISGALFSLGFWFFIDASVYSKVNNPGDVHVRFVDWIPGICSALGMLVINSIEKSRLNAENFSYAGDSTAWKARLILFLGFALMAGGLAGSVAVLVLKYIVKEYEFETMYFGIANVVANSLIMLSSAVLWVSQNIEDDYTYHL